eukprot:TRINITY_DN17883_c0_g1_i1.p1 TRINITY_DN17883_c0_g1~~TRINITY_DN17883_c0_g1_i1.p1  ORF type:complete len:647 (-),score=112.84 TRINITY_DN17883_c0_g1_i1:112-2052(-)
MASMSSSSRPSRLSKPPAKLGVYERQPAKKAIPVTSTVGSRSGAQAKLAAQAGGAANPQRLSAHRGQHSRVDYSVLDQDPEAIAAQAANAIKDRAEDRLQGPTPKKRRSSTSPHVLAYIEKLRQLEGARKGKGKRCTNCHHRRVVPDKERLGTARYKHECPAGWRNTAHTFDDCPSAWEKGHQRELASLYEKDPAETLSDGGEESDALEHAATSYAPINSEDDDVDPNVTDEASRQQVYANIHKHNAKMGVKRGQMNIDQFRASCVAKSVATYDQLNKEIGIEEKLAKGVPPHVILSTFVDHVREKAGLHGLAGKTEEHNDSREETDMTARELSGYMDIVNDRLFLPREVLCKLENLPDKRSIKQQQDPYAQTIYTGYSDDEKEEDELPLYRKMKRSKESYDAVDDGYDAAYESRWVPSPCQSPSYTPVPSTPTSNYATSSSVSTPSYMSPPPRTSSVPTASYTPSYVSPPPCTSSVSTPGRTPFSASTRTSSVATPSYVSTPGLTARTAIPSSFSTSSSREVIDLTGSDDELWASPPFLRTSQSGKRSQSAIEICDSDDEVATPTQTRVPLRLHPYSKSLCVMKLAEADRELQASPTSMALLEHQRWSARMKQAEWISESTAKPLPTSSPICARPFKQTFCGHNR